MQTYKPKYLPVIFTFTQLIIGSLIILILWPVKLLIEQTPLSDWVNQFFILGQFILIAWLFTLPAAWLFCNLRYSRVGACSGMIIFGTTSSLWLFILFFCVFLVFSEPINDEVSNTGGYGVALTLYGLSATLMAALYASLYNKT